MTDNHESKHNNSNQQSEQKKINNLKWNPTVDNVRACKHFRRLTMDKQQEQHVLF